MRCREIGADDLDAVAALLTQGFPSRGRAFWDRALARLGRHSTPAGYARYGCMLEHEGIPVGVLLTIHSAVEYGGERRIRCHGSSWYVEPAFRYYAIRLAAAALGDFERITYIDVSPAEGTLRILQARNYRKFSNAQMIAIPALARPLSGARVRPLAPDEPAAGDLSAGEIELLTAHQVYGCISLICDAVDGRHPFVFRPVASAGLSRIAGAVWSHLRARFDGAAAERPALLGLPFAYLVYCRGVEDFVRFAGPLGRFLLRRGLPLVVLDADGPTGALPGWYSAGSPKYFKGPHRPRFGDLAYCEWVVLGIEPLGRRSS